MESLPDVLTDEVIEDLLVVHQPALVQGKSRPDYVPKHLYDWLWGVSRVFVAVDGSGRPCNQLDYQPKHLVKNA